MSKKIAVVLCGCGFKDGSEIRESVAVLWALSRHPVAVQCFAPNAPQRDVVDCLTLEPVNETRNQLVESARIARGQIEDLRALEPSEFAAVIMPGGFGAAKNLCDFAVEGTRGSVLPELKSKLEAFLNAGKPIGAICISPTVLALAFPNKGLHLTLGAPSDASRAVEELGHKHFVTQANQCCIDMKNNVLSTPAYMYSDAVLCDVFEGIRKLVDEVVRLA